MEIAILIWVVVGAGITAGTFLIARAVIEVGALTYAAIERNISRREAVRKSAVLMAVAGAALAATAVIAALAVLVLFAGLLAATFQ